MSNAHVYQDGWMKKKGEGGGGGGCTYMTTDKYTFKCMCMLNESIYAQLARLEQFYIHKVDDAKYTTRCAV